MTLTPKPPSLGVDAKDTPSRLPRPTPNLLHTPTLNTSDSSTPHYGNSKIPRPQGVKPLPSIPFNIDSLKPLPASPTPTLNNPPQSERQKRFTSRLPSRPRLGQHSRGLRRDDSRKSLTTGSIDYAYVKKLKESSVAGDGPTLRISEEAEDIIFGPSDTVWSSVTAKLKLKSSPTSSKRVSPNSLECPSDIVFGSPVWFEESMSDESGSLASSKVAMHRKKALDFLEGRKGVSTHKAVESVYTDIDQLSTPRENNPETDDGSATVQGSSHSQQDGTSITVVSQQEDTAMTLVNNLREDARSSLSSLSSHPLIRSAEYARMARQVDVTSNLKAVRKVSNLRKTASTQAMVTREPATETTPPKLAREVTLEEPEIKLISFSEARKRNASRMQMAKARSTPALSGPPPSRLAHKVAPAKNDSKNAKPKGRMSKIPVYNMFSDMVNRRREKKEKPKPSIRNLVISSPKMISLPGTTSVGTVADRKDKYQRLPPTPPMSPPSACKPPMDRHKDMMVHASNLRQDARLVASQMEDSANKLELLRALELFNDTVMNSANALAAAESARVASLQARMYWESTHRAVQAGQQLLHGQVRQALHMTSNTD